MATTVEGLIRERLQADSAVNALIADRIFIGMAPQGLVMPFVVYARSGGGPLQTLGGPLDDTRATLDLAMVDASYATVKSVASAVREALDGWRSPTTAPAVDAMMLLQETDGVEPPNDDSDEPIYRVDQSYSLWYSG